MASYRQIASCTTNPRSYRSSRRSWHIGRTTRRPSQCGHVPCRVSSLSIHLRLWGAGRVARYHAQPPTHHIARVIGQRDDETNLHKHGLGTTNTDAGRPIARHAWSSPRGRACSISGDGTSPRRACPLLMSTCRMNASPCHCIHADQRPACASCCKTATMRSAARPSQYAGTRCSPRGRASCA